jgi:hypothetical protein
MPTSRSSGRRPSASGGSYRPCATSVRPQWPPTRNRTPPNGCSLTAASGSATAATRRPGPRPARRSTASPACSPPSSRRAPATAGRTTSTATGRRARRRVVASRTCAPLSDRDGAPSHRPRSDRSRRHPGREKSAPSPRSLRCSPSLRPRAEEHLDRVGDVDLWQRRRVGRRGCAAAARSEQERCDGRRDGSSRSAGHGRRLTRRSRSRRARRCVHPLPHRRSPSGQSRGSAR